MIKCLIAFPRAHELTRKQALEHYQSQHAPIVYSVPEFRRGMKRYIQNYILSQEESAPKELEISEVDGVSECWFYDVASMSKLFEAPGYMEKIRPDEIKFSDGSMLRIVIAEENVVFSRDEYPRIKLFTYLARKSGVSTEEFRAFWEETYAPAISADVAVRKLATSYIQNYSIGKSKLPFPLEFEFEGVDELWLNNIKDVSDLLNAQKKIIQQTNAEVFFDFSESMIFATRAVLIPGFPSAE